MKINVLVNLFLLLLVTLYSCKTDQSPENSTPTVNDKTKIETDNKEANKDPVNTLRSNKVSVNNLDKLLLAGLIIEMVNDERKGKGLNALEPHSILDRAASGHNQFMVNNGQLTHTGDSADSKDLRSRVTLHGGQFKVLAENIAMKSFIIHSNDNSINDTYEEVALQFFNMWKGSSGHYRNMMIKDLTHIGVALDWRQSEKAIYATQVFGG